MLCCEMPDPLQSCDPSDDWVQVTECDNIQNPNAPLPCTLGKARGLNFIGSGDAKKPGAADFGATMKSLGFTLDKAAAVLPTRFAAKLKTSAKTGHDWSAEPSESWGEETKTETHFSAPPGKLVRVFQVVGSCGPYTIRTAQFKKEEVDDPF